MVSEQDEMLREAAKARGFKLVKSRRRKAGGDFGKYGLVEVKSGRECMGFGKTGLTADAEAVLAFLRGGEVASWKRSLIGVVGKAKREQTGDAKAAERTHESTPTPARPERSRGATVGKAGKGTGESRRNGGKARPAQPRPSTSLGTSDPQRSSREAADERGAAVPELVVRPATGKDAKAVAVLLGIEPKAVKKGLAALDKAEAGALVAERGAVVGVAAWALAPRLDGTVAGRVTTLVVAEAARREGIGARLLAEVEARLAKAKVAGIEMLLDIAFDAPTGFLRNTGWRRSANGYSKG